MIERMSTPGRRSRDSGACMRYLRGFLAATAMHLRLYTSHPLRLSQVLLSPLQVGLTLVIVLKLGSHRPDLSLAVVGASMVGIWTALMGTATFTVLRERFYYGTFILVAGTPCPLPIIMAGFLTGEMIISLPAILVGFFLAVSLAGSGTLLIAPLSFVISLLIGGVGLITICLVISSFMILRASMTRWYNALEYPTWILGGFLFPIPILPAWVQPLCYAFSPYWVARALQRSIAGAPPAALLPVWGIMLGLALLQIILAGWLFDLVERRTRQTGELATE